MGSGASLAQRRGRAWLLFGLCSLAAVLTGCWSAAASGIPLGPLVSDVAAWTAGAALAVGVAGLGARWTPMWLVLAFGGLLLSLVSAGLSNVHRWFAVGPLRINAAELVLPIALASCAGLDRSSLPRLLFPAAATVVLSFQPDASQAVATAAGSAIMLLTSTRALLARCLLGLVSMAAVIASVLRPDPLAPVAQVEGVVVLAARLSPIVAGFGVACIVGSCAAPLLLARAAPPSVRDAALTLTAYSAVAGAAPLVGAFPVPLMGIAVSPIIGAWLGLGGLMHVAATPGRGDEC